MSGSLGFAIRRELAQKGFSEQAIRKLEQLSDFVDAIQRIADAEAAAAATQEAVDALEESQEDQNLSLTTLDGRVDTLENGDGPYVELTGDVMTGALDVQALLQCDSFRIDAAPTAAAAQPVTHKLAFSANGTTYFLLLSNV